MARRRLPPFYDPIKFLALTAAGDDVERVIVDGRSIFDAGEVHTLDVPATFQRHNEASRHV